MAGNFRKAGQRSGDARGKRFRLTIQFRRKTGGPALVGLQAHMPAVSRNNHGPLDAPCGLLPPPYTRRARFSLLSGIVLALQFRVVGALGPGECRGSEAHVLRQVAELFRGGRQNGNVAKVLLREEERGETGGT